jgi:spermidine synthase
MESATEPRTDRRGLAPIALLFLVSGASGLVYEVLWSRQLARVLGGSYPAVVAVVAAFLGGLALGSALGGRVAARLKRPLRTYALLEGGIGLYCAAFPLVLAALDPAFGWCYRTLSDNPVACTAARFALAAIAILPPTTAMGATLPILVRAADAGGRVSVLGGTGLLYGLNTLGAAGGALLAGFTLLPGLGFTGTLLVGVGANVAVAAAALLLDRRAVVGRELAPVAVPPVAASPVAVSPVAVSPDDADGAPITPALRRSLLFLAFGSGVVSMLYQLGWTRALVLCFGSSVQAFTLILSTFVLGLGLGGLLAPILRARGAALAVPLVLLETAVGVAGWTATVQLANLPLSVIEFHAAGAPSWGELLRWEWTRTLAIALLPTLAMGAVFPAVIAAVASGGEGASRAAGRVGATNTAGVLLGALVGGMLLIPAYGTRTMLVAAACGNLLLAAVVAAAAFPPRRALAAAAGLAAAAAATAFATPPWLPHHFHSGPYLYSRSYLDKSKAWGTTLARTLRDSGWDMPYVREGRSAGVAVFRHPDGSVFLRVNGKTDASSVGDMSTQLLLGHLPMLCRPGAERALVVGLASGVSASAVAAHAPRVLDVAEIAPEVAEAERCFRDVNGDVTSKPGVRVILDDGRTHIEHSGATYDAIVSEPPNPWIAGVSDLFTVEYYRACRARLSPGGALCVWLQAYGLSLEDFRLVVRTVRSVFPACAVWEADPWQDYLIVALNDDAADPVAIVASRPWPVGEAAKGLEAAGIGTREEALAALFLDRAGTAAFAEGGIDKDLHTDDRLQLEWRVPRTTLADATGLIANPAQLDPARSAGDPARFPGVDAARLAALRAARREGIDGQTALTGYPDPRTGRSYLLPYVAEPKRLEPLMAEISPSLRETLRPRLAASNLKLTPPEGQALLKAFGTASLERALDGGCRETWVRSALARALTDRGGTLLGEGAFEDAERDFRRALELHPGNAMTMVSLSEVAFLRAMDGKDPGRFDDALRLAEGAIALHPRCVPAMTQRASVLHAMGRIDEASAAFEGALAVRPDSVRAIAGLAWVRASQGRREEARILATAGLELQPGFPALLKVLRDLPGAR